MLSWRRRGGAGIEMLRLETGVANHAALALYEKAGFKRRQPFADCRPDPLSVFMDDRSNPSRRPSATFVWAMRRQIKNYPHVLAKSVIRAINCYRRIEAARRKRETDCRWGHVTSKSRPEGIFLFESLVTR
jgi:hypothetical protein